MKRPIHASIAVGLIFLFLGCPVEHEIEYVVEIESNTTWVVTYQGETIEGFGNRFIELPPVSNDYDLPVCVKVEKTSIRGYVKARVTADKGVSVLGSYDGEWVETYESFGEIKVCSKE